ncbi:hypothetical protein NDU88_006699 [Pleurodeles waltl]|uniref:Uncharacterized protein n=1 Tax=Pleurodeles waltl TaxID=8319 RepID=A0AAV7X3H1_PLEWA|nr:hypothetical protein NDU88_006699 [Pleurodeles waltl]
MEHILEEVTAAGHRKEGMDTKIYVLAAQTKSIPTNIAGFQDRVEGVERRLTVVKYCLNTVPDRDQELLYLRDKLTDLEDWSRKDNIRFFGFPEHVAGADVKDFLKGLHPSLVGLTFDPPLEIQWAQYLGP